MDTPFSFPWDLWDRLPSEVHAYIRGLQGRLVTLEAMVQTCQAQVQTLQEQLRQTSRHSSRPPSSDSPQAQRPKRP